MPYPKTAPSVAALAAGLAIGLAAGLAALPAVAQPIQGPQDAACREEATRRVFGEPNPQNLDPYARGRQYWNACMARGKGKAGRKAKRARRG